MQTHSKPWVNITPSDIQSAKCNSNFKRKQLVYSKNTQRPKIKNSINKKFSSQQNICNLQPKQFGVNQLSVEGWDYIDLDEQPHQKLMSNNKNILGEKIMNSSLQVPNHHNSLNKNNNKAWMSVQRSICRAKKQKSSNKLISDEKNCSKIGNRNRRKTSDNQFQQFYTETYREDEDCQQFKGSHIERLKTHAKNLENENFLRETAYSKQKNSIAKNEKSEKQANPDFLIFGVLSAKNSTHAGQQDAKNYRKTLYSDSNNYKLYKKLQKELINRTVVDNLKINGLIGDCSNLYLGKKPSEKNQQRTAAIHHSEMAKIPFQKFFNRKRNKCHKIVGNKKSGKHIVQSASVQDNYSSMNLQRIQGRKLDKMLTKAHEIQSMQLATQNA